ncbi:MAG: diguanylate cyclase [Cyanobium sp. CACIAM 14]|nr:MAG: diguanylate cyclase [Cyanobium sp. CACIAM 14]
MKSPAPTEDEPQRLAKLRSLSILDTAKESRFDLLTQLTQRLFKVPISMVSLVDENRQWFKSCIGLDASEAPRSVSFCGHAILGSDVLIVEDALKDDRFFDNPLVLGDPHIRFYAGCPLIVDYRKLGTLCIIDRKPRSLDAEQIQTLKDLASMVERELSATLLATKDELTGLSNRRGFLALAQQSLQLCTRQAIPVCLLYLDLDHLKEINDSHGHQEGDRALITFADRIQHVCRDSDVMARLGGDEFTVLLINATRPQAEKVIDRLKDALTHDNRLSGKDYAIDFSYGIMAFQPEKHETIAELLADADALMYDLKRLRHYELDDDDGDAKASALRGEASWAGFAARFQGGVG